MFVALQNELNSRILTVRQHLNICSPDDGAQLSAVTKGLVFVQLYAAHEYAAKGMVRAGMNAIKSNGTAIRMIRPELLTLVLDAETTAVIDAGKKTCWQKRIELFSRTTSADVASMADGVFPADGSQFRLSQLYIIWEIFGIVGPVLPDPRLTPLVGEIVENRNSVAHGRETAEEVGRRYTMRDIGKKIDGLQEIWSYLIGAIQSHCAIQQNLCR